MLTGHEDKNHDPTFNPSPLHILLNSMACGVCGLISLEKMIHRSREKKNPLNMYLMLHHLNNIKSYKVNEISLYISLEMERIIDKGDQIKVFFPSVFVFDGLKCTYLKHCHYS